MRAHQLGRIGEWFAAWFYRLRGYGVVARNVRSRSGEIDLVARRGNVLVVSEVKTRRTTRAGEGYEAVDRRKREQLIRLAEKFAACIPEVSIRYDILSLVWTGWRFQVAYLPDAFRPVADARYPWKWRA